MSRKIIGVTVGTPMKPQKVIEKTKTNEELERLEKDKLDKKELPQAVNTALAQAKASGEFNGSDGKDGQNGADGYTPQKGIDYFDGADGYTPQKGIDYFDGEDGYTPQKGVDYFDGKDGQNGKDGVNGKDGIDGKTPIKGTDYFTEADKAELVTDVLNSLPTWQGGAY